MKEIRRCKSINIEFYSIQIKILFGIVSTKEIRRRKCIKCN